MQAVIQDRYGGPDVVRLGELPEPVLADDEVLLRVRAVSLNGSDRENLAGRPAYARWSNGLRRPRNPVPGSDVAGVVAAVGSAVTEYAVGDELFGELAGYRGGLAELVCTRPKLLARKPEGLSFAEASTIPQAGGIARRATADVRPGDRVLVNGAGGAGGVFVVALAKHAGAEVTAVDRADKADFLREIGADRTIDFATEDWADERDSFDLIVDLVARRSPFRVHRALRRGGRYAMVGGHAQDPAGDRGCRPAGRMGHRKEGRGAGRPAIASRARGGDRPRCPGRRHADDRRGVPASRCLRCIRPTRRRRKPGQARARSV